MLRNRQSKHCFNRQNRWKKLLRAGPSDTYIEQFRSRGALYADLLVGTAMHTLMTGLFDALELRLVER